MEIQFKMNTQLVLFFCCATVFISQAFGQDNEIDEQLDDVQDALEPLNDLLDALVEGEVQHTDITDAKLADLTTNLLTSLAGLSVNVLTSLLHLLDSITDTASGFLEANEKLFVILGSLVRTGAIRFNYFLTIYQSILIGGLSKLQNILNYWSIYPANGILTPLGDIRLELLNSLTEPIRMLCGFLANNSTDRDTLVIATSLLGDIRDSVSEVKLGKCYGLSCISTLIPAAERIAQETFCS